MSRSARTMLLGAAAAVVATTAAAAPAFGQRLLDQTPNTRPLWTMDRWQPALIFSHRFEFISGGDELLNIPTISVGTAASRLLAVGIDFSSNTEVDPARLGGNEAQLWAALRGWRAERSSVDALLAYNSAARSVDGALTGRFGLGAVTLVGEGRVFSDAFTTGDVGTAGAAGLIVHLTPYLGVTADVGRAFSPDTFGTVWSGGVVMAIPGTRHSLSLLASNGAAGTLQGNSREQLLGPERTRYGFVFTAPLGSGSQWARVFRRAAPSPATVMNANGDSVGARVTMRDIAYTPREVRIRAGQVVEWTNSDEVVHTVTADDESWNSGLLRQGARFTRRFDTPGRYTYQCLPHPQMRGVVIVE